MNFIEVSSNREGLKSLAEVIKGGFDNPKPNLIARQILFSGWFLVDDEDAYLRVDYSKARSSKFHLDYPRPDVVKHFSLSSDKEKCGFYFVINAQDIEGNQDVSVSVVLNGRAFHVFTLKKIEFLNEKCLEIGRIWNSLLGQKNIPNNENINSLCQYNMISMVDIHYNTNLVFELLKQDANNPFSELGIFKEFVELFKQEYWSVQAIAQAAHNKVLEYQSVYNNQNIGYFCIRSYCIDDVNFLLFRVKNSDFYFYLGQYNCNVAILFPSILTGLALVPNHLQEWGNIIQGKLNQLIKYTAEHIGCDMPGEFLGANLSQSRPYHTVHDFLHGLEYLYRQKLVFDVVSNKNFAFINPAQIFDNIANFTALTEQEINDLSREKQGFYIMPCLRYLSSGYDRKLVNLANVLNAKAGEIIALPNVDRADLLLWIGISAEKRVWKEQIDGLSNIIKLLSKKYNLCVLIDGYTCTLDCNTGGSIDKERDVLKAIEQNVPKSVTFISLIGKTMMEKIAWSAKIDVFFTHFLTDSMYVSAIQKKPGVTYCSPYTPTAGNWIIHSENMIRIPNVQSLNPEKTYHKQSVSMNWQDAYVCIEQVLKKIGKL